MAHDFDFELQWHLHNSFQIAMRCFSWRCGVFDLVDPKSTVSSFGHYGKL
jgi:hypothetical protein